MIAPSTIAPTLAAVLATAAWLRTRRQYRCARRRLDEWRTIARSYEYHGRHDPEGMIRLFRRLPE